MVYYSKVIVDLAPLEEFDKYTDANAAIWLADPFVYYQRSSPLNFSPILIDLNWSRDAIVFIRGENYQLIVPVRGNTRMDRSRPWNFFAKQAGV